MRPPDENQPGSMRVPFMSVPRRPVSTEDNILARLERDGRHGAARSPWKRSWIARCGVASLAVIGLLGLLGLLASLARDNMALHQPAVAAGIAAGSTAAPDPDQARAPIVASEALLPPPVPALVVDVRPAPSLVMLAPTPVKVAAARQAARAPRKSAPLAAAQPPLARTVAASAARPKKRLPAPERKPAAAPEPAIDSDVALLSAIILHSSRHAGERAQFEAAHCGAGRKCPPAPESLTWLKTLD